VNVDATNVLCGVPAVAVIVVGGATKTQVPPTFRTFCGLSVGAPNRTVVVSAESAVELPSAEKADAISGVVSCCRWVQIPLARVNSHASLSPGPPMIATFPSVLSATEVPSPENFVAESLQSGPVCCVHATTSNKDPNTAQAVRS
jgi:hypothetical protein